MLTKPFCAYVYLTNQEVPGTDSLARFCKDAVQWIFAAGFEDLAELAGRNTIKAPAIATVDGKGCDWPTPGENLSTSAASVVHTAIQHYEMACEKPETKTAFGPAAESSKVSSTFVRMCENSCYSLIRVGQGCLQGSLLARPRYRVIVLCLIRTQDCTKPPESSQNIGNLAVEYVPTS